MKYGVVFIALLFISSVFANDSLNVRRLWREDSYVGGGGTCFSRDTFLFVTSGYSGMQVYSIADITTPRRLANFQTPMMAAIELYRNYFYAIDDNLNGRIFNVADPLHPVELPIHFSTHVLTLRIIDSTMYCMEALGIGIYSLSNPASPVRVDSIPGYYSGIFTSGHWLAVIRSGDTTGTWFVYNAANSRRPVLRTTVAVGRGGFPCAVTDTVAFFTTFTKLLSVDLRVAPPTLFLDSLTVSTYFRGHVRSTVYACDGTNILPVDFSDPRHLVALNQYALPTPAPGSSYALTIPHLDTLGIVGYNGYSILYDLTDPNNIHQVSQPFNRYGYLKGIVKYNNLLYSAIDDSIIAVRLDAQNRPQNYLSLFTRPVTHGVVARGINFEIYNNLLYVLTALSYAPVYSLTNPLQPIQIGQIDHYSGYVFHNGYGYQAAGPMMTFVADSTLQILYSNDSLQNRYMCAIGNSLYATTNDSIRRFDITNPAIPVLRNTWRFPNNTFYGISGDSSFLVALADRNDLTTGMWCFLTFHIDSTGTPQLLTSIPLPFRVNFFKRVGNYAVIWNSVEEQHQTDTSAVVVVNMSALTDPYVCGYYTYSHPVQIQGVDVEDNIAYVSTNYAYDGFQLSSIPSSVNETRTTTLPISYSLNVSPNPFNNTTNIKFDVPVANRVKVAVYDALGRQVVTLADKNFQTGNYRLQWNGNNANDMKVSSGLYFISMRSAKFVITKKAILLK